MCHHAHLTLSEREDIMVMRREGRKITEIAGAIGRSKSTVSRELRRNSCQRFYRASTAQGRCESRRKACRRPRILDDDDLFRLVRDKFLGEQWSPEQIKGRLALELGASPAGDSAIYWAIAEGRFDAHAEAEEALGAKFFFALPHHPWQRGTNENTNGLLREYFPKRKPLDKVRAAEVKRVYDKINRRPRKRLGYRTPYEAHYGKSLHLI